MDDGGHISGPASKDPFCHRTLHGDVDSIRARGGCPIGLPRDARHHSHRCGEPRRWMKVTPLLWVVACPCALLLATPMPHAALAISASNGAIARRGDIIERTGSIDLALLTRQGPSRRKTSLDRDHHAAPPIEDVALRLAGRRDDLIKRGQGARSVEPHVGLSPRRAMAFVQRGWPAAVCGIGAVPRRDARSSRGHHRAGRFHRSRAP